LARHNFSSVFRTIYLRVRFFISAFFEANWEIKFLFLYSGVLPKFTQQKKVMPYRARSMQEKKIRLYPLIATFSDSSCKQSKPQTTKTTQNKLIQKFLLRVFFFCTLFRKYRLNQPAFYQRLLQFPYLLYADKGRFNRIIRQKGRQTIDCTLTNALFHNLYVIELPQNNIVSMSRLPKN